MKSVTAITARCKELLECSDIPATYKAVLHEKYEDIERHLHSDGFAVKQAEFLALHQFEKMLQKAQLLHDYPSAAHSYSSLLQSSMAIVHFLGQGYPTKD